MGFIGIRGPNGQMLYRCECGNTFELDPNATRCPCECHNEALNRAKQLGLYCEDCGFSSLEPTTFQAHFGWATHQKAVAAKEER
jgi:DNA-directed RNA polymerase subunit RPC12/RpoP